MGGRVAGEGPSCAAAGLFLHQSGPPQETKERGPKLGLGSLLISDRVAADSH